MNEKIKKIICILLVGIIAYLIPLGCRPPNESSQSQSSPSGEQELPLTVEYGIADQSNLYGICYHMEGNFYWGTPFTNSEIPIDVQLIANLGAKTVRHWMHCTKLMVDKDTINEAESQRLHIALQECQSHGIINIGMNHHNFNKGVSSGGKPARNMTKGSDYIQWLDDYYTTWFNLVKEFPEVTYWEIDNELNNPDFMYNAYDKSYFSAVQMAQIATDMLYYATRAIHDANPNAKSVMGGLTEPMGFGYGDTSMSKPTNAWFLQEIYNNIFSGEFGYFYSKETSETASVNPDDYFDVFSYHPYVWSWAPLDKEYFISESHKLYQVILDNEGKHKKVFITEVGFSEFGRGQKIVSESITNMYTAIASSMPYVETLNYFKLYDIATEAWAGAPADNGMERYGLFYDFNHAREYYQLDPDAPSTHTDKLCVAGAPKDTAYTFQQLAGGKGLLTLMQYYFKNKESQNQKQEANIKTVCFKK